VYAGVRSEWTAFGSTTIVSRNVIDWSFVKKKVMDGRFNDVTSSTTEDKRSDRSHFMAEDISFLRDTSNGCSLNGNGRNSLQRQSTLSSRDLPMWLAHSVALKVGAGDSWSEPKTIWITESSAHHSGVSKPFIS